MKNLLHDMDIVNESPDLFSIPCAIYFKFWNGLSQMHEDGLLIDLDSIIIAAGNVILQAALRADISIEDWNAKVAPKLSDLQEIYEKAYPAYKNGTFDELADFDYM
ncbi:MAG: hypothetical protein ABIL58_15185 [Pseudomonadota bacterium]